MSESFGPVAEFYDDLMAGVPYQMWVSYLLLLWAKEGVKPKKILDVCCGTGTAAGLLLREGRTTTGIDLSPQMIEQARAKDLGLRFEAVDAADFDLGETFEAAYSFFDSLNYITDPGQLQKVFYRVAAHLEPGSTWIFDLNTRYAFEAELFDQENMRPKSRVRYKWKAEWDPSTLIIRVHMRFWVDGEQVEEIHIQRAHPEEEVREMLANAGFENVRVYNSYTLDKPRKNSDRVHYVCRRAV